MLSLKSVINAFVIILLFGCGSSSESSSDNSTEKIPVIEEPAPVEDELQEVSCSSLSKLNLIEASSENELASYGADKAIDKTFTVDSRWSTSANISESALILTLDASSLLKGISITWLNQDQRTYGFDIEVSKDKINWTPVLTSQISNHLTTRSEFKELAHSTARYLKVTSTGSNMNDGHHIIEVEAFGCQSTIESTIELNDWYLSIPVDENYHTKSKSIYENTLKNKYFNAQFFFLSADGGITFRAPIEGAKTSSNTKYTRTELREMLRRGDTSISTQGVNKNNWVFSTAPSADIDKAGGVDGELVAELAVNHVTKTGDNSQVGRVIIGQIHANDDEPIRVYYRKLPNNSKGSIYLAHEIEGGEDIYVELIGTRSKSAENPINGIALNERFGYIIRVTGTLLTLTITREGQDDISTTVDMVHSGYDLGGQYMYFKAGVYNQNNTGNAKDYVQATFYTIENRHIGYLAE